MRPLSISNPAMVSYLPVRRSLTTSNHGVAYSLVVTVSNDSGRVVRIPVTVEVT